MAAKRKTQKSKTKSTKESPAGKKAEPSADDVAFANNTVIPLLYHMGFTDISLNHGIDDLNGDVLFGEYDRFGIKKHYLAYVRAKNISGKAKKDLSLLIDRVSGLLSTKFDDPTSGNETSITGLYVMTGGSFTNNAVDNMLNDEGLSNASHRLFFYDKKQLETLFERNVKAMKELAVAVQNELKKNSNIAQYNMDSWSGAKASLFRYQSLNAQRLIDYLVMKEERKDTRKKLEKYFFLIDSFNQAANIVLFSNTPSSTVHYMKRLEEGASAVYKQSEELLEEVGGLINPPAES